MNDDELTPEQAAELAEWQAKLEARSGAGQQRHSEPPPDNLTPHLIQSTPDAGLQDLVIEFVDTKKPVDLTLEDNSWLDALPLGLQLMWCSIVVESELTNGGFNQLFFNGTDAFAPGAIAGFEAIGAAPFGVVINEAMSRASERASDVARSWGQRSMGNFMESYGDEIFKDLDDRFFALYESVDPAALRIAWIRAHAAELQWGVEG